MTLNSRFQKLKCFCQFVKRYHKTHSKKYGGVDNGEKIMIREISQCTVRVRSKIENATNLQNLIAY